MLRSLSLFLFVPACLVALLWSLFGLRAEFVLSNTLNYSRIDDFPRMGRLEREQEFVDASRAASLLGASANSQLHLSSVSRELGFIEADPGKRMEFFCRALSAGGRALRMEPYNSRFLVNWANLRQLLGQTDCQLPYTVGDFTQALYAARKADPTNPELMYASALISAWSGKSEDVRSLLRDVLTYKTSFGPGQERVIAAQFKTAEDLSAIVPGRFPQVAYWADWVRRNRRQDYSNLAAGFRALELEAIAASRGDLDAGLVSFEIHRDRLVSLLPLIDDSQVRRQVDAELALMVERDGDTKLGSYLRERSGLASLEVLRASIESDTRPLKGNFSLWGRPQELYLDDFYGSVGFYLPTNQTVRLIELAAEKSGVRFSPELLRVLVSENNLDWQEMAGSLEPSLYTLTGRPVVVFRPGTGNFKYWKIHFDHSERGKTFGGNLSDFLRVYGISSRKAG